MAVSRYDPATRNDVKSVTSCLVPVRSSNGVTVPEEVAVAETRAPFEKTVTLPYMSRGATDKDTSSPATATRTSLSALAS